MQDGQDTGDRNASPEFDRIIGREENLVRTREINAEIDRQIYESGKRFKLDVVLNTFADGSSSPAPRYCGTPKREITRRCAASLARSLEAAGPHIDAQVTILDDHSNPESVDELHRVFAAIRHPYRLLTLKEKGIMASIRGAYEHGLHESRGEIVYFVQDDYLHSVSAIEEMVDSQLRFSSHLGGREVGIYPFDDPFRYYAPRNVEYTRLIHGRRRHWRLNYFSSCVFMTTHATIRRNWDLLDALANAPISMEMEDNTINRMWQQRKVALFTPVPSLALHLQGETEKDPFLDWRGWWEQAAPEAPHA